MIDEGYKTDEASDEQIVQNVAAKRHFYSKESVNRLELGPGIRTQELRLFIIDTRRFPSALNAQINDRVDVVGGQSYNIIGIRPYERELQLDTELIG